MNEFTFATTGDVYLVYDGDCPLCRVAANGWRIQKATGRLHLVNRFLGAYDGYADVSTFFRTRNHAAF